MKKLILGLFAIVCILIGFQVVRAANAPRDENRTPSVLGADCNTTVTLAQSVGDDLSSNIVATTTARSYLRLQQVRTSGGIATSSIFLSFDEGAYATVGNGIELSTSTPFIEVGLNTDFPYVGTITGITNGTASTTVLVTSCSFTS